MAVSAADDDGRQPQLHVRNRVAPRGPVSCSATRKSDAVRTPLRAVGKIEHRRPARARGDAM
jgi:hypothetical protein